MNNNFKLAVDYLKKGNYQKAEEFFNKILSQNPKDARVLTNLGVAYKNQGRVSEAISVYEKAIEADSGNFASHNNLANIFLSQGRFTQAREHFLKAINIKNDYSEAYGNLGVLFQTKGDPTQAQRFYKKALKINPKAIDHLSNLSTILEQRGALKEAENFARKALAIDLKNASSHNNLANILRDKGDLEGARDHYKKAIKLDPRMAGAYSNLVDVSLRLCFWDEAERFHKKLDEIGGETPFLALRLHREPKYHALVAKAFSSEIAANALRSNLRLGYWLKEKGEKIKIGYLSANFCNHPIGQVVKPVFSLHDRKKFTVYAFSYGPNDKSAVRREIERKADKFVDLRNLSDAQAAKKINKHRIDILVDLTGHTQGGRMGILAHHPSPFQISWLGFCGTSGAEFMEYMIVDEVIVPKNEAKYYSEKLIYLPGCYQINEFVSSEINDGKQKISGKKFSKKDFGIPEDTFFFCSFNRPFKIDESIFLAWMKILKKVPKSVLILWQESETAKINLQKYAKKKGVDPKRLIFVKDIPLEDHLARLSVCDLALDTRFYSGGATTANMLLVSLPVITIKGSCYFSRMSESLLHATGLGGLVADSIREYVNLAVDLAKDPQKLSAIRKSLIMNLKSSSLFNAPLFVKNLEKEYLKIVTSKTPE